MRTLTVTQAAEYLGMTRNGVIAAIRRGTLPAKRLDLGSYYVYRITQANARKFRNLPRGRGRPRTNDTRG